MVFGAPVYHLVFVSHGKASRKRQHFLKVALLLPTHTGSAPNTSSLVPCLPPSTGSVLRSSVISLNPSNIQAAGSLQLLFYLNKDSIKKSSVGSFFSSWWCWQLRNTIYVNSWPLGTFPLLRRRPLVTAEGHPANHIAAYGRTGES